MNILLLDAHTVQSISVARSLKENGHVIFGFIESRLSYGYVSRFVDHKILCPILRDAPSEYLNFLVDFLFASNDHFHTLGLHFFRQKICMK